MAVPYTFGSATSAIPLSQLDSNFATTITLGNTAIQLGNTVTTLNNMTLANVTISSGNVTITNVSVTTANVTTLNAATVIATTGNITTVNATTVVATTANATTANITTGNLTDLNLTNNPTFSGGTANGVLYLNGSKVATSGSALTWDGTTLTATNASAGNYYSSAAAFRIGYSASYPYIDLYGSAGNIIAFGIAASEAMRLTSTGLGVGTSSPASKFDLEMAAATNGGITVGVNNSMVGTIGTGGFSVNGGAITDFAIRANANLLFATGTSAPLRMTLDSSGNLTLGNAAAGVNRIFNINGVVNKASRVAFQESGVDRWLIGNGAASENGNFEIYDATNGNNFVLTRSGNLGLGVSPPTGSNQAGIFLSGTNNVFGGAGNGASFTSNVYNSSGTWKYATSSFATLYQQTSGQHVFYTAASGTATNNISWTQAMTLDGSGRLLVGATTSGSATGVMQTLSNSSAAYTQWSKGNSGGGIIGAEGTGLWFYTYTGNIGSETYTERARIDSSGNLLVGTTSAVNSTSRIASHVAAGNIGLETNSTSTANYYPAVFYNNTATAGYIQVIGTVTTYNSISDYRLKTVIGSVSDAGTRIDALEPVEYEWKSNGERTRGFLAHKFQEVYPQSVSGEKDAVDADGKPVYQAMQASTSEVIADLVAELQSLRKRVALLEGK